ncbi:MAG: hypothetical protein ABSG62_16330 [Terracidiphilus sp.]|jgi:hypothetical protein
MFETFSYRQKQRSKKAADVFTYDELPNKLRVQAARIWSDAIDAIYEPFNVPKFVFESFHELISKELGVYEFGLYDHRERADIMNCFTSAGSEDALDILEMMFVGLTNVAVNRRRENGDGRAMRVVEDAVDELNRRFLQHGVGYAFVVGDAPQIIRMDNEHLHHDVVMPALMLLSEQGFEGANDEYRKAHKHYQDGNEKECLNECLKAFESTMKTICARRKWSYQKTDAAKKLIDICLKNNLLPAFMQSHLGTVRSALESAIPTVRNKMGGHGQGPATTTVPPFYAVYLLHETAATIVFLVSAFKALP